MSVYEYCFTFLKPIFTIEYKWRNTLQNDNIAKPQMNANFTTFYNVLGKTKTDACIETWK